MLISWTIKFLALQCLLSTIVLLLNQVFLWTSAQALILGSLSCLVPNAYFALRAIFPRNSEKTAPQKIMQKFYRAEAGKFIFTMLLSALSFRYLSPEPLGYWAGFGVAWLAFLLAPFVIQID